MKYTPILKAIESEIRRLRQVLSILNRSTTDVFEPEPSLLKDPACIGVTAAEEKSVTKVKWKPSTKATLTAEQWAGRFQPWVACSDPRQAKHREHSSEEPAIEEDPS